MPIPRPDVVVLAAGNGLRLAAHSPLPKPLVSAGDRPLLDHLLTALADSGLRRVCVVVGHAGHLIRAYPFQALPALDIQWVVNADYRRPNGLSLLCAEGHVAAPFLLLMADHLFQAATLQRFIEQPCPPDGVLLAVDRKLDRIYDIEDATKVAVRGPLVQDIGKDLGDYDAVDTGMFLCSEAVFDAMHASVAIGGESLSAGIQLLARTDRVGAWDIAEGLWIDVDTPGAHAEAERLMLNGRFAAGVK